MSSECPECGGVVPATSSGRYCCRACAKRGSRRAHRKKARANDKGAPVAEAFDPRLVFMRAGWRCEVPGCRRATPRERIGSLLPDEPTLDHHVALALGGAHTLENARCACRGCNERLGLRAQRQARAWEGAALRYARR